MSEGRYVKEVKLWEYVKIVSYANECVKEGMSNWRFNSSMLER